ncbi:hypothetical protein ABI59_18605 [Acidobacteria bacterium Mor1]|nr:hypothetical protein ABI59_18605 [Acidobacteria bacterium Mor1]
MTLFELARTLPNGFHDAELRSIHLDYEKLEATLTLDLWIGVDGTREEIETYEPVKVRLSGLEYFLIDAPNPYEPLTEQYKEPSTVRLDLCEPATEITSKLPGSGEACLFFVDEWNSYIHLAAAKAQIIWRGDKYSNA